MATLSVLVITYNHAPYLRQCLDSILSQVSRHEITITIFEDCSTDGTQEIVKEYLIKYPGRVRAEMNAINRGKKEGFQGQLYRGFMVLDGDFIAMIEGDDYWSDEKKIEQQVNFLEANPDFAGCTHHCVKTFQDGSKPPERIHYTAPGEYNINEIVYGSCFFHISSAVYRNIPAEKRLAFYKHFYDKLNCEIYINMAFAQNGKIYHFDKDMSVYRVHSGGLFSTMSEVSSRIFNLRGYVRYNIWLRLRYIKGLSFTVYRLSEDLLQRCDVGLLPSLKLRDRIEFEAYRLIHLVIYDLLDTFPQLDPAVFWFNEQPKSSKPRLGDMQGWLRPTTLAIQEARKKALRLQTRSEAADGEKSEGDG